MPPDPIIPCAAAESVHTSSETSPPLSLSRALGKEQLNPTDLVRAAVTPLHAQSGGPVESSLVMLVGSGQADDAHFSDPEIHFHGLTEAHKALWNKTLVETHGMTPRHLRDRLIASASSHLTVSEVTTEYRLEEKEDSSGTKVPFIQIEIGLFAATVKPACEIELEIDFLLKQVRIERLVIKPGQRSHGLGTRLTENIIDQARNFKFEAVDAHASYEAGPYFWPRRGFIPTNDVWQNDIAPVLQQRLAQLARENPSMVVAGVVASVSMILKDENSTAILRVAELKEPLVRSSFKPQTSIPLGRALLAESRLNYDARLKL